MSSTQHGQGSRCTPTPDAIVHVVDDDEATRDSLRLLLKTVGLQAATYALPTAFIETFDPDRPGCVVLDLRMPEANGIETLSELRRRAPTVPVIFVSGYGDLATVVRAMKLGAVEFFEKPFNKELLIETIQRWVRADISAHRVRARHKITSERLARLSRRERQVLECVLDGMSNKEAARHLGVSPKAVEIYRGHLMRKMEATNVVALVLQVAGCLQCARHQVIRPPCLI